MRRLLLVPALALAATAALAAPAGAGDQEHRPVADGRVSAGGGVSVVLPAGWHLIRRRLSEVTDPIPRLAAATFPLRLAARACECDMPHVRDFPRNGAFVFVWEYRHVSRRDLRTFPTHETDFRIGRSAMTNSCSPSDGRSFRERGRGFQVEIYLGPDAPTSAGAQIAAILDSWRVTGGAR